MASQTRTLRLKGESNPIDEAGVQKWAFCFRWLPE
jgi:hypothetical protein